MDTQCLTIAGLEVRLAHHPQVWSPLSAIEMMSFLVENDLLVNLKQRRVLDFGTGSGIVGIVCGLLGAAPLVLSDYSKVAADMAVQNAQLNKLFQVQGVQSDRFAQIPTQPYDLIISNPPVQPWLFTDLDCPSTREKAAAWNEAGADGRLVLDALLKTAQSYLVTGGQLITSASSRHGQRQTVHLLNTFWPNRWQQIYASEHAILPDYHGPYIPMWQRLQALDGDLRIYQMDDRGRRFAKQADAHGQPIIITTLDIDERSQPVLLYPEDEAIWSAKTPDGQELVQLSSEDNRLPGPAINQHWYYEYYLFQAFAP
ncbi:methyltransferase [Oscillatoria sp. CS-180]|uniref:methyltransferase n=1 Tax=Oscillatoria sp. CS-180 TaxID=3021720 RepID=UPI00232C8B2C|nr:methyltransferase [Oscillatoria sp. CS-180]MDB9529291.1 methyltransferase [Oscillatoria sp. CS-180]